jgi:outer membrane protein
MNRLSRGLCVALAFGAVAPALPAQTPTPKLAYVNSAMIVDRAPGAAAISATLDKERNANMAKIQKMRDSLDKMIEAFNKDQPTMTDTVKARRTKAIQDKQAEYSQRAEDMEQQMQQRQNDLVQPIMTQIREVLDKIRQEEGYLFIFDVAGSNTIVAADKNLDITERVIARLKPVSATVTSKPDSAVRPPAAGTRPPPAGVVPPRKPPAR